MQIVALDLGGVTSYGTADRFYAFPKILISWMSIATFIVKIQIVL